MVKRAGVSAALLALASCGGTTRATAPQPGNVVAPQPPSWMGSTGGTWRAPAKIRGVVALDAGRALVLLGDARLAVLDVTTGVLGAPIAIGPAPLPHADRLIALGGEVFATASLVRSQLAVVRIDPTSLATTPVPLEAGAVAMTALAVSADEQEVAGCAGRDELVIRDAGWQVVARIPGPCVAPWLLPQGEVTANLRGETVTILDRAAGTSRTITGRKQPGLPRTSTATWIDGGGLVDTLYRTLGVTAAGGAGLHDIALPGYTTVAPARPRDGGPVVVALGDSSLAAIDVSSGTVHTDGTRNLTEAASLLARGGDVVSSSDAARRWHWGALAATGPRTVTAMASAGPTLPIWLVADDQLQRWDGISGALPIASAGACDILDATADTVAYTDLYDVMRLGPDGTPATWFRYDDDLILADMDVPTDRLLLANDGGVSVVRPATGRVFAVDNVACWSPSDATLATGVERMALDGDSRIDVYDTSLGARLSSLEIVGYATALAFVGPEADQLVVLVDEAVLLWRIGVAKVRTWPLHPDLAPTGLDVSTDGRELALGFKDGTVMWLGMDELVEDSVERAARLLPPGEPCDDGTAAIRSIDLLRGEPDEPDEGEAPDEPDEEAPDEDEAPDESGVDG